MKSNFAKWPCVIGVAIACSSQLAMADDLELSTDYTSSVSSGLDSAASVKTNTKSNAASGLELAAAALSDAESSYTLAEEAVESSATASTSTDKVGWTGSYACTATYKETSGSRENKTTKYYTDTGTYSKHYSTTKVPSSYASITVSSSKVSGISSKYDDADCDLSSIKFDED